ncbi:MAG: hypothetical protein ABI779_25070 [Acidobacteriota bacterium]
MTIVDFMAFLVPGVVLLFGLTLAPVPDDWLAPLSQTFSARIPLLNNPWAAGGCWILSAYVLGFLLRLVSLELMNVLTSHKWVGRVSHQASELSKILELAINDEHLATALKAVSKLSDGRGVSECAPYFHFAKRVIRTRPELWVEAERLEAEVRLAAGLFIPFIVLVIDGVVRISHGVASALVLLLVGLAGATIVFHTFPERRIKEVLYDQLLAIIALRQSVAGKQQGEGAA